MENIVITLQIVYDVVALCALAATLSIAIIIYKKINSLNEIYNKDNAQRHVSRLAENDILRELTEYAVNSGLECLIMPDGANRPTLFVRDSENESIIPICVVPQVEKSAGAEYNKVLENLQQVVNEFIKNNPQILGIKNDNK
jgi:hypothetical protein